MQIPRIFQLSGETNANQRLLAKKILADLEPGEEITLIVSQEETVKEVQGWAQAQGLLVSSPKKKQQGQWEFTIERPHPHPSPPPSKGEGWGGGVKGEEPMAPRWVWKLLESYVRKSLEWVKVQNPTQEALNEAFLKVLTECSAKVLVQEPWLSTIRFKAIARYGPDEVGTLFKDPEGFLHRTFGGGKFKINLYHGMNFAATKNFLVEGEPRWQALPELEE